MVNQKKQASKIIIFPSTSTPKPLLKQQKEKNEQNMYY